MTDYDDLDLYGTLEVQPSASIEEIKQAYKRLILIYHPDKAGAANADDELFRTIRFAWDTLSDPEKRRKYDEWLHAAAVIESRAERVEYASLVLQDNDMLTHPCRCGDVYKVNITEFEESGADLIPCNGCSLYVKVLEK